jgi:hypothetical protein
MECRQPLGDGRDKEQIYPGTPGGTSPSDTSQNSFQISNHSNYKIKIYAALKLPQWLVSSAVGN